MNNREIQDLIAELRFGYARTKDKAAFLSLKQSELRPDDQISLYGFMEAKQQLEIEQSLLSGHAHMACEMIGKSSIKITRKTRILLKEITAYTYNVAG